ncbi:Sensor protein kinase WalK [Methyloligella halotolerans]|uniref:histidine kinase n=1 Tax=Methyloligella halotolerans TaxID=1177755 RepID=A0A1E2S031_9HYPH|nr:ATP-binding protein [Methyloligella halotolerans]ODA67847.1 Sensor protein kinase WalK [Methyloligella halotolerans]
MRKASWVQSQISVFKTSLRNKIVLMALAIAFLASIVMGVATYRRSVELARELGAAKLRGETQLVAAEITEALRDMSADVSILASTSPINGIIRSVQTGDVNMADGSSLSLWKSRLARIFESMLEARPFYMKIRYVGLADRGHVLVRVDRMAEGLVRASEEDLQFLEGEPYFETGVSLEPGEWTYSEVSLNRENGQVDTSRTPTLRAIYPVFDRDGKRFGMIIINADYEALLANAIDNAAPETYTIAANEAGDYLIHDAEKKFSELYFHDNEGYALPEPLQRVPEADKYGLIAVGDDFFYAQRSIIDLSQENLVLNVLTRESKTSLLAPARRANLDSLLLGLALLVFTSTAAFALARKLTKPLQDMTDEVGKLADGQSELHLPTGQPDEIGALARAFQGVTGDLLESETKIRAIIDNVADGLIVTDEAGRIELVNPACAALFNYSSESMTGMDVTAIVPDGLSDRVARARDEVTAKRRDGTAFDAELSVSTVQMKDRTLYCGIVRDISERKKVERMKNEFVSTVNHELRTPLTSIAGSLSLLRVKADGMLDPKCRRLIELAETGAARLGRLVNDILDVEKIEAGKLDCRMAVTDLVALVPEVIAREEPLALRHGITFHFHAEPQTAFVKLDPDRFEQALVNLLSNAAKYSETGSIVEVKIRTSHDSDRVGVTVTDHGPGIPKAFEQHVFERFTQADLSGSQKKGSSGLGLYITKTLVETFGGTISFRTTEGVGTSFDIELPVAEGTRTEERKMAS